MTPLRGFENLIFLELFHPFRIVVLSIPEGWYYFIGTTKPK